MELLLLALGTLFSGLQLLIIVAFFLMERKWLKNNDQNAQMIEILKRLIEVDAQDKALIVDGFTANARFRQLAADARTLFRN